MGEKKITKVSPIGEEVEQEAVPNAEELVAGLEEPEKKEVTVHDILVDHEQRLVQMEAKWFRLGGI